MRILILAVLGLFTGWIHLGFCGESRAGIIYQTGFENPPFTVGALAGQDSWNVFSAGSTPGAVTIESGFAKSGSQAMEINTAMASGQTGGYRLDPSSAGDTIVQMQADVYLASSTVESGWQFAALTPSLTFIGGFNVLIDGTLQLITSGFPITAPVVTRNAWNHYEVDYDFTTQTFNVLINQQAVASNVAFIAPASVFSVGIFDTFNVAEGNDIGYLDNYSITGLAVPEPSSLTLLGTSSILLLGSSWLRNRRRRA